MIANSCWPICLPPILSTAKSELLPQAYRQIPARKRHSNGIAGSLMKASMAVLKTTVNLSFFRRLPCGERENRRTLLPTQHRLIRCYRSLGSSSGTARSRPADAFDALAGEDLVGAEKAGFGA